MAKNPQARRVLNCLPSQHQEDDWGMAHAASAGMVAAAAPIPAARDLRANWWAIGDQASTGSCVGWATADSVLRWHFVQANRIGNVDLLSVRFTWMAAKETDQFVSRPTTFIERDGTSLKAALDVARRFGAVREAILPFASAKLYPGEAQTFYLLASALRISAYVNLGTNLNDWKRWLATHGPILTRLDVDATWDNAASTAGVLGAYQPATVRGGHAVALVGYDPNHFIVRNSWGTSWGKQGFGFATPAYAQAAFTEAYGVAV